MQRDLSDRARLLFRKYDEDKDRIDRPDPNKQMELGFEYQLETGNSFKVALRDDEEFVGVEHKSKF